MVRNQSMRPESGVGTTCPVLRWTGSVTECVFPTATLVPQGPTPPTVKGQDIPPNPFLELLNGQSIPLRSPASEAADMSIPMSMFIPGGQRATSCPTASDSASATSWGIAIRLRVGAVGRIREANTWRPRWVPSDFGAHYSLRLAAITATDGAPSALQAIPLFPGPFPVTSWPSTRTVGEP